MVPKEGKIAMRSWKLATKAKELYIREAQEIDKRKRKVLKGGFPTR